MKLQFEVRWELEEVSTRAANYPLGTSCVMTKLAFAPRKDISYSLSGEAELLNIPTSSTYMNT